jgi:hypothetical protein
MEKLLDAFKIELLRLANSGAEKPKANTSMGIALYLLMEDLENIGQKKFTLLWKRLNKLLWKELGQLKGDPEVGSFYDVVLEYFIEIDEKNKNEKLANVSEYIALIRSGKD